MHENINLQDRTIHKPEGSWHADINIDLKKPLYEDIIKYLIIGANGWFWGHINVIWSRRKWG